VENGQSEKLINMLNRHIRPNTDLVRAKYGPGTYLKFLIYS